MTSPFLSRHRVWLTELDCIPIKRSVWQSPYLIPYHLSKSGARIWSRYTRPDAHLIYAVHSELKVRRERRRGIGERDTTRQWPRLARALSYSRWASRDRWNDVNVSIITIRRTADFSSTSIILEFNCRAGHNSRDAIRFPRFCHSALFRKSPLSRARCSRWKVHDSRVRFSPFVGDRFNGLMVWELPERS